MTNKIKYPTFCADCGYPIRTEQIGTTIRDFPPDFTTRETSIELEIDLCSECWERIKNNVNGGMSRAMKRKREILKHDVMR